MCGILGVVGNIDKEIAKASVDSIKHRGPDDHGYFETENVFLGHTRLAILDLSSNGHQPMISSEEKLVIIFNGEIYNHLEIRKRLLSEVIFKSTSDTETILYGYRK